MHPTYNYTSIKKRESKLYSIQDIKISQVGISTTFLATLAVSLLVVNIFGVLACLITGQMLYMPITAEGEFNPNFLIVMLAVPLGISYALLNVKIQNYRLLEFLIHYFKPKSTVDQHNQPVTHSKVSVHAVTELINLR